MKPRASLFALSFSAGLLALSMTGCSSLPRQSATGPDAAKPVGGKTIELLQLRDHVKSTRLALNRTTDALNRVIGASDTQEAYAAFSNELTSFKKLSDRTLKESGDVRVRGRELFAEWDQEAKSIKNPDIRAVAEQRRATLQSTYDAMVTPLLAARADLTEVASDLTDIQKALALDLTPAGIGAVKKPVDQINQKTAASARSLDALALELDKIALELPAPTLAPVK